MRADQLPEHLEQLARSHAAGALQLNPLNAQLYFNGGRCVHAVQEQDGQPTTGLPVLRQLAATPGAATLAPLTGPEGQAPDGTLGIPAEALYGMLNADVRAEALGGGWPLLPQAAVAFHGVPSARLDWLVFERLLRQGLVVWMSDTFKAVAAILDGHAIDALVLDGDRRLVGAAAQAALPTLPATTVIALDLPTAIVRVLPALWSGLPAEVLPSPTGLDVEVLAQHVEEGILRLHLPNQQLAIGVISDGCLAACYATMARSLQPAPATFREWCQGAGTLTVIGVAAADGAPVATQPVEVPRGTAPPPRVREATRLGVGPPRAPDPPPPVSTGTTPPTPAPAVGESDVVHELELAVERQLGPHAARIRHALRRAVPTPGGLLAAIDELEARGPFAGIVPQQWTAVIQTMRTTVADWAASDAAVAYADPSPVPRR